ncbi:hypothetical protein GLOIN_2v1778864 [Rhizophagus irregularis DAOM 181602=DAOM 197198]|nr:hypothetical protein GLOIN_2v1778864 [Rhizophagus irregularis DAOM 181602=DAOM 197198]
MMDTFLDDANKKRVSRLNCLDVCLEQTVRSHNPLAVEMRISTFSLLYEKLRNAEDFADHRIVCPKDGLPSDEKTSELSHPDLGSGSDKKILSCHLLIHQKNKLLQNLERVNISPASQPIPKINSTHDCTYYFQNKTLDQYPNLYREFSSENFDYYGITDETSCLLCKLGHDNDESIEDRANLCQLLPTAI